MTSGERTTERDESMLVLVAHGSRNPEWRGSLEALTETVREGEGREPVELAFMQFTGPTLPEVVEEALEGGTTRFRILPLFMASAGHVDNDIRPMVEVLRGRHPEADFEIMTPVGEMSVFHRLIQDIAIS